ncbi:serine hydrolase [Erythrobacter sp. JK5]|uniref:serine hydrolase n=1 Tax=Erythrobacter sp. JK5 TaxID=2829500 RepID=UPI001BAD8378|nr:serine hydrolase [Erythrobacter sp. JK5]QUL38734.1 serine hydrolase [Erythrobacter sp. JK5]
MRIVATLLIAILLALGTAGPSSAQETDRETDPAPSAIELRSRQVVDVINGDIEPEQVFSASFLATLPPAQIKAFAQSLTSQFGAAIAVERLDPGDGTRAALDVRFERGIARGGLAILPAEDDRISELVFTSVEPIIAADDSAERIRADLAALPGTTNALFARLGGGGEFDPVLAHNDTTQLALGSTFKLYVLSTLARSVADGSRAWDEVVALSEKSFPSGQMQDWPQGSPVTLHTLATLMISISDNTATDQLIATLGREAIEAELVASGNASPSNTVPLLKTRELFAMRGVSDELIESYRAADDAGQRRIIAGLTEADVSQDKVQRTFATDTPGAIDIEWFASPRDLAGLLRRLAGPDGATARDIMAVKPRLTDTLRESWDYAGFKGGSEPGVLNLTWLLRDAKGAYWIATVGWNNPEAKVDPTALEAIAQRMIALPR